MSVTTLIIIVTGIFTYMGLENHRFFEKYKFSVSGIQAGEYYRFITGAFLHGDWIHFLFNMITLYFFGNSLTSEEIHLKINTLQVNQFLLIYFGGIIIGNYLSYYFHKKDLWYSAIGASAGVNAVVFSFISLNPKEYLYLYFIIPIPAAIFAFGYLWYTVKGSQNAMTRIGMRLISVEL